MGQPQTFKHRLGQCRDEAEAQVRRILCRFLYAFGYSCRDFQPRLRDGNYSGSRFQRLCPVEVDVNYDGMSFLEKSSLSCFQFVQGMNAFLLTYTCSHTTFPIHFTRCPPAIRDNIHQ